VKRETINSILGESLRKRKIKIYYRAMSARWALRCLL